MDFYLLALEQWMANAIFIGMFLLIVGYAIYGYTSLSRTYLLKILHKRFNGLDIHKRKQPGDVNVEYETYRGLLLFCRFDRHRVYCPPKDAKILLRRLLIFNLTWGMTFHWLVLVVPFLAIGNHLSQLRSVNSQVREMKSEEGKSPAKNADTE